MILIESGNRIHATEYDWPKNPTPSGFTMKLRKHLRNRRLESIRMLGMDRIVDFCFGSGEAAYHVIAEIYDRGNIVLTDHELTIMNILRARADESQDVRFAVRERYPVETAHARPPTPSRDALKDIFAKSKPTEVLKRVLNPHLVYGPAVIEHALLVAGLNPNSKSSGFDVDANLEKLEAALTEAENILNLALSEEMKGFIVQKKEKRPSAELADAIEGQSDFLLTYDEFQPYFFQQFKANDKIQTLEFATFSQAVDEFFSKIESQKIDTKALQQEKSALKKLENVKADHAKRLQVLRETQEGDREKGDLIELNVDLVEMALSAVRSLIANQVDWEAIRRLVGEAAAAGDPVASRIKGLKLETNSFVLLLHDPYEGAFNPKTATRVEIDVELSAHANSRRYFDHRRQASEKENKTVDSSTKALKNAEKKTKQVLREEKEEELRQDAKKPSDNAQAKLADQKVNVTDDDKKDVSLGQSTKPDEREEIEELKEFPDTEIRIQVDSSNRVKKLKAFKGLSALTSEDSSVSHSGVKSPDIAGDDDYVKEEPDGTKIVTLGDNVAPLILGPKQTRNKNATGNNAEDGADRDGGGKPKLSAKQRRDLKKKKKQQENETSNDDDADEGKEARWRWRRGMRKAVT